MKISFNVKDPYTTIQNRNKTGAGTSFSGVGNKAEAGAAAVEAQKKQREQIRNLAREKKPSDNPYAAYGKDSLSNIFGEMQGLSSKAAEKAKNQPKKKLNYNPTQIANKILAAKTSLSAGNALLAARRKVVELKKKLVANRGNADEVQTALIHAERMEIVAKRKKRDLEMEEMVERVSAQDAREEDMEKDWESMERDRVMGEEEKVAEAEDAVFDERQEAIDQAMEELAQKNEEMTEELSAELAELGEELIAELEDQMEALQDMEILNPHMSEEKLEEVKCKHRAAEERAILKANMEYFKATIKHAEASKGGASGGAGSAQTGATGSSVATASAVPGVSVAPGPSAAEIAGVSSPAPAVSIDASV